MLNILFFILLTALAGGLVARFFKIPSLVGYIAAGIIGGLVFSPGIGADQSIVEMGVILLLFSVGLEISFEKIFKIGKVALIGAILQIAAVALIIFWILVGILKVPPNAALVLALAFSMSSTALIVKILQDNSETGTIQYQILTSWALVQDLAVIPIVVLLPTLVLQNNASWSTIAVSSILTTTFVLGIVFLTGKLIAPYLTKLVAATNNHELLVLLALTLALGIANLVGLFGISSAFGAFLAGVVISKTQENHAIFSETRPLRDIFSILFFVSLGFLVTPSFIISHLLVILLLAIIIILVKIIVVFFLLELFDYRGKTAIAVSFGLAQVGEFAFVLFIIAQGLGILTKDLSQIGISTTIVTLLVSPFFFRAVVPVWKKMREVTKDSALKALFNHEVKLEGEEIELKGHVVLAGYGRMGKWIGKALTQIGVKFVVIDYNHRTIAEALKSGVPAIYGDASFPEILEEAKVGNAKALLITVPDATAQEEIILYCQKNFPGLKIMARAHLDKDIKKLVELKIDKVVQPEFEAALAVVKSILINSGRSKEEVNKKIKSLRLSHANI